VIPFAGIFAIFTYRLEDELDKLVEQINASGYGLTLGVHTRIDETIAQVTGSAKVGNLYVNYSAPRAEPGQRPLFSVRRSSRVR
jgi:delta 1-pyrroline-5-carboxylate dehydrogenase